MEDSSARHKKHTIIVNGREKPVSEKELCFMDIVKLAFGTITAGANTIYTMTFKRGMGKKHEGSLVDGDCVRIKPGMIFNVTATDKS